MDSLASNTILTGTLAMITGDIVGSLVDHMANMIDQRVRSISALHLDDGTVGASLLDTSLALFIHSGMLIISTEFSTAALPWITQDSSALVLFFLGLWATSPHLVSHLKDLNKLLLEDSFSNVSAKIQE